MSPGTKYIYFKTSITPDPPEKIILFTRKTIFKEAFILLQTQTRTSKYNLNLVYSLVEEEINSIFRSNCLQILSLFLREATL